MSKMKHIDNLLAELKDAMVENSQEIIDEFVESEHYMDAMNRYSVKVFLKGTMLFESDNHPGSYGIHFMPNVECSDESAFIEFDELLDVALEGGGATDREAAEIKQKAREMFELMNKYCG